MKKNYIFFLFFFVFILIFSQKFFANDNNFFIKKNILVGYFFEKYPFFYFDVNDNTFKGKDLTIIRNILNKINYNKNIVFKKINYFQIIKSNFDIKQFDFIIGGIIDSSLINILLKKFNKFHYFHDKVYLIKRINAKDVSFDYILKNKISFAVKQFSLSYYLTSEIKFRKIIAFYQDYLRLLKKREFDYGLIDSVDLEKIKKNLNTDIISVLEVVYEEDYIILINKNYFSRYNNLYEILTSIKERIY